MISIKNISKSFGSKCVLKAVNLTILDKFLHNIIT